MYRWMKELNVNSLRVKIILHLFISIYIQFQFYPGHKPNFLSGQYFLALGHHYMTAHLVINYILWNLNIWKMNSVYAMAVNHLPSICILIVLLFHLEFLSLEMISIFNWISLLQIEFLGCVKGLEEQRLSLD